MTVKVSDLVGIKKRNMYQCRAATGDHVILSDVATVVVIAGAQGTLCEGLLIGYMDDNTGWT